LTTAFFVYATLVVIDIDRLCKYDKYQSLISKKIKDLTGLKIDFNDAHIDKHDFMEVRIDLSHHTKIVLDEFMTWLKSEQKSGRNSLNKYMKILVNKINESLE
jgi:hypothetical protein